MRILRCFTIFLFVLCCQAVALGQGMKPGEAEASYSKLKAGFKQPVGTALPKVYWWWLNGNMDTVRMKEELKNIKGAGIGGVDILEIGFRPDGVMPAGPEFMGPESLKAIGAAIKEAGKLGLEVGLNLSSSWNAGGKWITAEHSAKSLYQSTLRVKGGDAAIRLPFPTIPKTDKNGKALRIEWAADGKPVYRKEIAVVAVPVDKSTNVSDTAAILNLTHLFNEQTELLNWTAPAGDWMIHRFVCSSSGEELKLPSPRSAGPIIDHFDSVATEVHFMYFINKLKPLLGDFKNTALKNFYLASFEATGTVWTPTLASTFRQMHGYDIAKFLPYLFDRKFLTEKAGEKFKKDYDHTISELMINNHYRKGREIANRYGLKLISESGGPGPPLHNVPVESMKALGALDVPRGEFWINHSRFDGRADSVDLLMLVKEIASASRIYGRKITELESFTSFQNWQEGPGDMRPVGDRAFCEGMNRVVIHGFTHNPTGIGFPGIVYAAGTHYNDKTTWWSKVRPFNEYLSRVSYILQETEFVADAVYYYGDKVPNFATPKNTRFAAGSGYDYEIINTEILLRDLRVKDGVLTLPRGGKFKVLALGAIARDNKLVWDKIKSLIAAGAVVTLTDEFKGGSASKVEDTNGNNIRQTGNTDTSNNNNNNTNNNNTSNSITSNDKPNSNSERSAGGNISEMQSFKELLPDDVSVQGAFTAPGNGSTAVVYATPASAVLKALAVLPDFNYPDKGSARLDFMEKDAPLLDYIHYQKDGVDFYFIRNTSTEWVSRNCTFRQAGKSPELWDPMTGKTTKISIYELASGVVTVPLTFAPHGSYFVMFKSGEAGNHWSQIVRSSEASSSMTVSRVHPDATGDARVSSIHPPLLNYKDGAVEILSEGNYQLRSPASTSGDAKPKTVRVARRFADIAGSWDLSFPKGWGAPRTAKFPKLISWTESDDPGIKYFSGTGTYTKVFNYKPAGVASGDALYLDLGRASKVVEVWLNGQSLGISWALPHRFNVTGLLKTGNNDLKIEVINTWSNRIIGDISSEKKYTYTNLNVRGSRELLWTETPLVESGLLGPVRIETVNAIKPY